MNIKKVLIVNAKIENKLIFSNSLLEILSFLSLKNYKSQIKSKTILVYHYHTHCND